jgi:hypothetical protein
LAASLEVADALGRLDRLSPLPGALNPVAAEQVFLVAPSRVRSIHAVLLHLAGRDHHGPRLYRALVRRPPDRLTGIVMGAVRAYEPDDRHLYVTLLRDGGRPQPTRELKELVVPLLLGMVDSLPEGAPHRAVGARRHRLAGRDRSHCRRAAAAAHRERAAPAHEAGVAGGLPHRGATALRAGELRWNSASAT